MIISKDIVLCSPWRCRASTLKLQSFTDRIWQIQNNLYCSIRCAHKRRHHKCVTTKDESLYGGQNEQQDWTDL